MRRLKKYIDFKLNENDTFPTDRGKIIKHLKSLCRGLDLGIVTIHEDGTVDIQGNFRVESNCKKLPIKFGRVTGTFYSGGQGLTTLQGCPHSVKNISLESNQLTDLKGFPKSVSGSIDISWNSLTSLEGLPEVVNGNLRIQGNNLTSLKGGPRVVRKSLNVEKNNLSNLEGCPQEIGGALNLDKNPKITSLNGLPKSIGGPVSAINLNKLYMMDKYEGVAPILFWLQLPPKKGPNYVVVRDHPFYESPSPIEQVCQLFETFKDFNDSLDYKYFKMIGDQPAIIEWRFREALEEFDLPFPVNSPEWKNKPGFKDLGAYIYIDDDGNRLENLTGVEPYKNSIGENMLHDPTAYVDDDDNEEWVDEEFDEEDEDE